MKMFSDIDNKVVKYLPKLIRAAENVTSNVNAGFTPKL